jgi:hypothetical protein
MHTTAGGYEDSNFLKIIAKFLDTNSAKCFNVSKDKNPNQINYPALITLTNI